MKEEEEEEEEDSFSVVVVVVGTAVVVVVVGGRGGVGKTTAEVVLVGCWCCWYCGWNEDDDKWDGEGDDDGDSDGDVDGNGGVACNNDVSTTPATLELALLALRAVAPGRTTVTSIPLTRAYLTPSSLIVTG